jgi:hypothetical protein
MLLTCVCKTNFVCAYRAYRVDKSYYAVLMDVLNYQVSTGQTVSRNDFKLNEIVLHFYIH